MNQIGEKISIKELSCREIYLPDLMSLLKYDRRLYWSWGVSKLVVDSQKGCKMLRLTVSGHHHKGYVYIFLNGMDLFDVVLTSNRDTIKDCTSEMGVYFDQLVEWIDGKIKNTPENVPIRKPEM